MRTVNLTRLNEEITALVKWTAKYDKAGKLTKQQHLDLIQFANHLQAIASDEDGSFEISAVCREDLLRFGVDVSKVKDSQLEEIASDMGDYFTEYGGYWDALEEYSKSLPKTPWGKSGWMQVNKEQARLIFKQDKKIMIWVVEEKTGKGIDACITSMDIFLDYYRDEKTVFIVPCD